MKPALALVPLAALLVTPFYLHHKHEQREAVLLAKRSFVNWASVVALADQVERITGKPSEDGHKEARAAEKEFMQACTACAAAETCERDRLNIFGGRASETYNPCD